MKKRLLSLLLALTMIVGMLPMGVMTATAATNVIEVDTWEELEEALEAEGTATVVLTGNVKKELPKRGPSDFAGRKFDYDYPTGTYIRVCGDKNLDLNGYSVEYINHNHVTELDGVRRSGHYYPKSETDVAFAHSYITWTDPYGIYDDGYNGLLNGYYDRFRYGNEHNQMWYAILIPEGQKLTVNDSVGTGKISHTGYIFETTEKSIHYMTYIVHAVFRNHGTLIINGGEINAGNESKQWIVDGTDTIEICEYNNFWNFNGGADRYDGYAHQVVLGEAVHMEENATLVVNGGTLVGRGQYQYYYIDPDSPVEGRSAIIQGIKSSNTVIINGGSFKALSGADVFGFSGDIASEDVLSVRAGYFVTDKHDKMRSVDYFYPREYVYTGSYGNMGIPSDALDSRSIVLKGNKTYTYPMTGLDLDKTGGQTSGKKLEVTIVPDTNSTYRIPITLNGGPYSNYPVNDGQVIDWNAKSDNLVATVDYDPYFDDTTGLKDAAPVYTWHLWGLYGTNGEVSKDIVTTTGRLDISAEWKKASGASSFREMKVSCTVSEAPTNCENRIETKTYEFRLDPTNTPLDKSSLPGGEMEVDISYPNYSGSNTDIVVTVKPSAEDLADAAYGSSTVRYEYLYRDNMAEWDDEPFAWYNNTYNFSDTDWGHVKFDVTMIVYGSDGIARRFTESAWALKLPDITVSGATLNSDKTAYVGNPGTPVTLKAPIDVTNAEIAADKIKASDIAGLYRVTYDNSGKPVMSLVTAGSYTQYQVTGNGTYCYAAYDRDGNLVYSKPVKVEFNAEAYGIGITKSNDYIFTVYNNGSVPMPLTITATYGSSVSLGNIRWAIQSYPQGMSTSDFTYVNANGKSSISFQKLFKDVKTIVPGNYVVMAYVVKDGQYLTASNCVTVEVGRIADFVDITDEAGNVISGKTMEGPYVGNTMKLNCVPGNGASAPSFKSVTWKVESLVGTNVATIDANGVLTINKPGQIKVTATTTVGVGQTALANNTQTVIINIPITEVEVTLGTPTVGGDPDAIASVPADAPYELVYNPEYSWISGVHPDTDKFAGNLIPELRVGIAPKDGYVFPARQTDLAEYGDETWFTYADEVVVKVNGKTYNFRDFEKTYTYGYTEYGKDYDGTFWEDQEIQFYWTWDRLRSANDTYLNYVNLSVDTPAVGSVKDTSAFNLACSNNAYANNSSYIGSVYKVSGDNLNDNDTSNDNAVSMATGETYAKRQMYRVTIMVNLGGPYASPAQYFEEQVTAMVNNEKCIIEPITGSTLEGQYMAKVSYYFMPTAPIQTIENLYIADLFAPVGYQKPATADDITEFRNSDVDDEVYVTRLTWFFDSNNNNVLDSGEDSTEFFNADGSFIAGLRYSVYLELEARDSDGDGKGDYVKFADNAKIYLPSQGNAQMTGNPSGAVYKFPAAGLPAKAVTTDPGQVIIEMAEGYSNRPIKRINVTSVGTTEITSITAEAEDSTLLQVDASGMSIKVLPTTDLAKGTYRTSVVIKDDDGNVLTTVPVTITVGKPSPEVYVGGVGMFDGDYLAVGATATQTTKPSGGYAYYKDGKLTLNNYSYEGEGYQYNGIGYWAIVYAKQDLTVELVGTNSLVQEHKNSDAICIESEGDDGGCITIDGTGSLSATTTVGYSGIYVDGTLTVNGGTIDCAGKGAGMRSKNQDIIINGGNVTVSGQYGLMAYNGNVKINGGNVLATGTKQAVNCDSTSFTVAAGMKIQASTTVDGELGEYVAANHNSYKKVVIEPAASNITVNCIGDIDYTVSGNVVTVDHEVACKVGYLDGTTYKAITAVANGDGTYSFTAPAGITEVLLVVKGDINGDGEISLADSTRTKAAYNKKTTPTVEAAFAADANGDGEITLADSTRIKAAYNKKTTLSW